MQCKYGNFKIGKGSGNLFIFILLLSFKAFAGRTPSSKHIGYLGLPKACAFLFCTNKAVCPLGVESSLLEVCLFFTFM